MQKAGGGTERATGDGLHGRQRVQHCRVRKVYTEVLAGLYERLAADALSVIAGEKNAAEIDANVWGPRAYYFAESCEMSFRQFMVEYMVPALKRVGGEGMDRDFVGRREER